MQWISPSQRELVEEYERLLSPTREMGESAGAGRRMSRSDFGGSTVEFGLLPLW